MKLYHFTVITTVLLSSLCLGMQNFLVSFSPTKITQEYTYDDQLNSIVIELQTVQGLLSLQELNNILISSKYKTCPEEGLPIPEIQKTKKTKKMIDLLVQISHEQQLSSSLIKCARLGNPTEKITHNPIAITHQDARQLEAEKTVEKATAKKRKRTKKNNKLPALIDSKKIIPTVVPAMPITTDEPQPTFVLYDGKIFAVHSTDNAQPIQSNSLVAKIPFFHSEEKSEQATRLFKQNKISQALKTLQNSVTYEKNPHSALCLAASYLGINGVKQNLPLTKKYLRESLEYGLVQEVSSNKKSVFINKEIIGGLFCTTQLALCVFNDNTNLVMEHLTTLKQTLEEHNVDMELFTKALKTATKVDLCAYPLWNNK